MQEETKNNVQTPGVTNTPKVNEQVQSPESENTVDKGKNKKKNDKELEKLVLENQKLLLEKQAVSEKIIQLHAEKQAVSEKFLRLNAEMQNMSRRHEMEKSNLCKYDGEKLIKEILPIIDNFERALAIDSNNASEELNKFLSGVKMIYTGLLSVIENYGVKEINALNQIFDPNTMEAIMTGHDDKVKPGIVLDVMQKGYMYKDKVVRHAMVKVSE